MKKTIISILLLAIPVVLFAQLKVLSDGHVSVGVNNGFANTKLFVGDSITNHLSAYDKSLFTLTEANAQYSVGQLSIITPPSDGVQRTCVLGQMGLVTPYCANRAIAIHGWLTPSNNGVAVYGSIFLIINIQDFNKII